MKRLFAKALLGLAALLAVMPLHAAAVLSKTNSIQAVADASATTRTVEVLAADLGGGVDQITGVTITIDFMKCADPLSTPLPSKAAGCPQGGGAFAREIIFRLTAPSSTQVSLVEAESYFAQNTSDPAPGARITVVFADSAADAIGTGGFVDGTFQPVGFLGSFSGEGAVGTWELYIEDDAGNNPLGFASFTLDITIADPSAVPAPATALLLGLGFAGMLLRRRRR